MFTVIIGYMTNLRAFHKTILIAGWMLLVLLACNISVDTNDPPTLVPRPTSTIPTNTGLLPTLAPGSTQVAIISTPSSNSNINIPPTSNLYPLTNQVSASRMMDTIRRLESFYTRHVNSTQSDPNRGIGAAANYIFGEFEAIRQASPGSVYTFQQDFELEWDDVRSIQRNIVLVVQGTEPGAGTVVVGAHYDSVGDSTLLSGTAFAPGANDNASGVSGIIEIARIVSQEQLRSTVIFVAFSAEEVGRKGSRVFADWIQSQNIDVIAMLNVDTIGSEDDRSGNRSTDIRVYSKGPNEASLSRQLARTTNFAAFNHGVGLEFVVQDAIDREDRYGDHFSFDELGYPAIRFIQALEAKANADPTDTSEFIEPDYLQRTVQSLLIVTYTLADGPRPPQNITLRNQGGGLQQLLWEPQIDAVSYVIALRWPNSLIYGQQFETSDTFVEWDQFGRYEGVAIAAKDNNGILGPLSAEYGLP